MFRKMHALILEAVWSEQISYWHLWSKTETGHNQLSTHEMTCTDEEFFNWILTLKADFMREWEQNQRKFRNKRLLLLVVVLEAIVFNKTFLKAVV